MPDVDATLLAIFGLGQAAYLGKKAAGDQPASTSNTTESDKAKKAADQAAGAKPAANVQSQTANAGSNTGKNGSS
jgi:hypothetical protein